jgi:hypothetical protein
MLYRASISGVVRHVDSDGLDVVIREIAPLKHILVKSLLDIPHG